MRPNIMVGFEIARILIIIGRCDPYRTVPDRARHFQSSG
jgi:hypothetical protein